MQVWTKTTGDGKRVELKIDGRAITIYLDGQNKGTTHTVMEITEALRRPGALYAKCPRVNAAGEKVSHAVHTVILTAKEAAEVLPIWERETADEQARSHARALAEVADQYAEAKRTGKPVEVDMWVDTCNDRNCNCCATFHRMVKPDGMFAITCNHSY